MEYADSLNVDPHKWLLTTCECSLLYVRNTESIESALVVRI